jgi:hypothetical protein
MRKFRTPMKRTQAKADPVTPELRLFVLRRDGACVAAVLAPGSHECRDSFGTPHRPDALWKLQVDHIRLEPGGKRRSVASQLVSMCANAHLYDGWATANRPAIRAYLRELPEPENEHAAHVDPCSPACRSLVA